MTITVSTLTEIANDLQRLADKLSALAASLAPETGGVEVGQIYVSTRKERFRWQVASITGGKVWLERLDTHLGRKKETLITSLLSKRYRRE